MFKRSTHSLQAHILLHTEESLHTVSLLTQYLWYITEVALYSRNGFSIEPLPQLSLIQRLHVAADSIKRKRAQVSRNYIVYHHWSISDQDHIPKYTQEVLQFSDTDAQYDQFLKSCLKACIREAYWSIHNNLNVTNETLQRWLESTFEATVSRTYRDRVFNAKHMRTAIDEQEIIEVMDLFTVKLSELIREQNAT